MENYSRIGKFVEISLRSALIVWSGTFIYYLLQHITSLSASRYVTLSFSVILVSFGIWVTCGFFCRKRSRSDQLLAACFSIATLYVVEVTHYKVFLYPGFPELSPPIIFDMDLIRRAEKQDMLLDARNSFEVVHDLRMSGIDAYPAFVVADKKNWPGERISDEVEMIWPLGGISNRTIVHCNESGYWSIYESDEFGFNNPRGLWQDPVDVMLLGDSFVHGACVNPREDLGGRIRGKVPRTLNLGQRGNGPILNLATLKEYGKEVKPRKVIWFYTEGNDLINLRNEKFNPFLAQYLTPEFTQGLVDRQDEVDKVVESMTDVHWGRIRKLSQITWQDHIKYVVTLRSLRKRFGLEVIIEKLDSRWKIERAIKWLLEAEEKIGARMSESDEKVQDPKTNGNDDKPEAREYIVQEAEFVDILNSAIKEVDSWGGDFYFVYLPAARRYQGSIAGPLRSRRPLLDALSNNPKITIIDGHKAFVAEGDPMRFFPFRNGGHYNAQGYAVIAEKISQALMASDKTSHNKPVSP
jgi:hypothetical protein